VDPRLSPLSDQGKVADFQADELKALAQHFVDAVEKTAEKSATVL
jgi:hypothetical protein